MHTVLVHPTKFGARSVVSLLTAPAPLPTVFTSLRAHPHFNSLAKSPTCKNILITGVAVADRRLLLDSTLPSPDHDLPFPFSVVQESPLGAARLADSSLVLWRLPGRFGWGDRMKDEEKDLFAAIEAGDTEKVLELLKSGIDINCHDATGMSPLATAAYRGNFEIAKLCIEKGGDVNDKQHTQSYTPLMFAALAVPCCLFQKTKEA
ncbi:hypothetical protein RB195_009622 [Necator americanus]|uniref:Ankyrin repeat protein n=1 Tax=Necator americanus TaxID=51031 RepID=A0ABR1CU55_NECAM